MDKNKLRIIFLDMDGVLDGSWSKYVLDHEKVALLEKLIKDTDAKIVVSSSWSTGSRNAEDFINKHFYGLFKRLTNGVSPESLFVKSIIDVTDHMGSCRGDEIKRWLEAHEDEVESYVIIDDDSDMLDEQLFNFVQTDGWYGLSERTTHLATQILMGVKIISPIRLNMELIHKWRLKCDRLPSNIEVMLDEYNLK